jgi:hypothetical protein
MSTAPIAALVDLRVCAIVRAPHEKIEMRARRSLAPSRSPDINTVRDANASQSTAQK